MVRGRCPEETDVQRWEYCRLSIAGNPGIDYYTTDGIRRTTLQAGLSGLAEPERLAIAIAQLGEEGWEMVAIESGRQVHFKRPRP